MRLYEVTKLFVFEKDLVNNETHWVNTGCPTMQ